MLHGSRGKGVKENNPSPDITGSARWCFSMMPRQSHAAAACPAPLSANSQGAALLWQDTAASFPPLLQIQAMPDGGETERGAREGACHKSSKKEYRGGSANLAERRCCVLMEDKMERRIVEGQREGS